MAWQPMSIVTPPPERFTSQKCGACGPSCFSDCFSSVGYDYAVEKAGSTVGWSFTIYEEAWNYGFPQEMAHFVDCVQHNRQPLVTGEDGRAVLEAIFAAYESAGSGRKVELPFQTDAQKPYDLWRKA